MIESDFLLIFFNLNPLLVATIVLIFNFISLLIPAVKLNSVKKLFTSPAFVIGDFLTLPLATFLMINFYRNFEDQYLFAGLSFIVLAISIVFTLYSGMRFKLMHIYWVPHGVFHFLFGYMTLSFLLRSLWGGIL